MTESLRHYVWSVRGQFLRYALTGGSGVILDMATLVLFREILGFTPVLAVALNQFLVLGYNFTLNKYWSFENRDPSPRQLRRYLTLAAGNYLFSVGTMYLFSHLFGWDYRLVRMGTIVVMTSWNFLLYKHWVYRP